MCDFFPFLNMARQLVCRRIDYVIAKHIAFSYILDHMLTQENETSRERKTVTHSQTCTRTKKLLNQSGEFIPAVLHREVMNEESKHVKIADGYPFFTLNSYLFTFDQVWNVLYTPKQDFLRV